MQNVIEVQNQKRVGRFALTYPIFIGIFSYLFYTGEFGVSVPIFTLLFIGFQFWNTPKRRIGITWAISVLAMMISSIGILRFGNTGSYWAYVLAFIFNSVAVLKMEQSSVLTSIIHFFKSFGHGMAILWIDISNKATAAANSKSSKTGKRWLVATIAFVVLIVFFFLYRGISPEFKIWTDKIDLDFISIPFIFTFIISFALMYGIFHRFINQYVSLWERKLKRNIQKDYSDSAERYFSLRQEKLLSGVVFLVLILMIGSVIGFEINRYVQNGVFISGVETYTHAVHSSVYLLIFSIVLAVTIISLSLRGRLNFVPNKSIKILAISWMLLNIGLVLITGIKNYEYVLEYGFTYKRMGVFIYLLLTLIGMFFTLLKIVKNHSIYALVRNVSLAFFLVFMVSTQISWDKHMVTFNTDLRRFSIDQMDLEYMHDSFGDDAQIMIHQFLSQNEPLHPVKIEQESYPRRGHYLWSDEADWRGFTFDGYRFKQYFQPIIYPKHEE